MSWAPIGIALVFGLLISATLHFIFIWPAREPEDDAALDISSIAHTPGSRVESTAATDTAATDTGATDTAEDESRPSSSE